MLLQDLVKKLKFLYIKEVSKPELRLMILLESLTLI
jgi:hypothetical protein